MNIDSVGVIGGGAWGTALAQTLCLAGRKVEIWAREPETVEDINTRRVNRTYLPGIPLSVDLKATSKLADITACDCILCVTPAQHVREISHQIATRVREDQPFVLCSKGIERKTGKLMSDVVAETIPQAALAVLSGPSFASEVARGLPAALALACRKEELGKQLAQRLGHTHFRLYWSSDITGAEIGGSVKNVFAIAAGIVDGKGLGKNAHAALVTRGFAELRRLGEALGAKPETLTGLSGLGDLILTCGSPQSRNMSLGRALGEGKSLDEVLGERVAVTEGVFTAAAVAQLAHGKGIELPIAEAVHAILEGRLSVDAAISGLVQRPFKAED